MREQKIRMKKLRLSLDYENVFLKTGIAIFAGAGVAHWLSGMMNAARQDIAALSVITAIFVFNMIADRRAKKNRK